MAEGAQVCPGTDDWLSMDTMSYWHMASAILSLVASFEAVCGTMVYFGGDS